MRRPYPSWVCDDCGLRASSGKKKSLSTYHEGTCDVCKTLKAVTEPRDFFYPDFDPKAAA